MLRLLAGGAAHTDVLVAADDDVIIGHAMAGDRAGAGGARLTEIGVVVADAYRGLGLGSALVRRMAARARLRGVTAVVMEVLAENRQVLTMIADHWQVTREDRSGACITIWAPLPPEARREEPRVPGSAAEPRPPTSGAEPWLRGTGEPPRPPGTGEPRWPPGTGEPPWPPGTGEPPWPPGTGKEAVAAAIGGETAR